MIVFQDMSFESPTPFAGKRMMRGDVRETMEIKILNGDYNAIKSHFVDGMAFSIHDEFGDIFDESEYNLVGDIIDHGNGTFTVYACQKNEKELLEETNANLLLELGMTINGK